MTYQVLARKWRPKDFASLVGQEHVVRALTHALDGGRLHHAYLFTGTRGVGKTTLSRIFAKALNCETGVTSQPCGVCRACREIDEGRFVDYVEMDAASNRGVDEMAALLERAVYAPVDARFKVYMIDEVHMLTNHAFNAMLKTLEEPPPHVKFILATTDPQKIPVTVLSRCLQFNLKQMPAGHIVSHLERILGEEEIAFEPQALRLLARAAQGSMRDALSLTDQAIAYSANEVTETAVSGMLGTLDQTYMVRLLDALAAADGPQILAVADEMALRSLSFSAALQDLASLLHRIAWAQFAPASVLDEWPEAADLRRFSELMSPEQVQLYYQIATVGRGELGLAPDEYAGFTMTLLRMLAFEPATTGGGAPGGGLPAQASGAATKSSARAAAALGASAAPTATAAAAQAPKAAGARATAARSDPPPAQAVPTAAERSADAPANDGDASANARVPAGARSDDAQPRSAAPRAESSAPANSQPSAASESAARAAASPEPTSVATIAAAMPAAAASTAEISAESASAAAEQAPAVPAAPAFAPASRATGAAAALDVLRNAGMRVSSDRGRGAGAARSAEPAAAPAAKSAPRVPVPTPRARSAQGDAAPNGAARAGSRNAPPPWEDIPPDDYVPFSMDDGFIPPDDGFVPVFDSGPDDVRGAPKPAAAPPVDTRPLPEAIPLDAIGYDDEWPTLAASLPLKGVAYQLAFNSELTSVDGGVLKLAVPVPQYADAAQVAKLKAALADALGKPVEVSVEVGPARRTAAAIAAAERAKRQREAEQEMSADPFVQQLLREFGASIVEGSIRPVGPEAGAADGAAPTLH
ncbi:DNA polymerase III subunit gamma/tau [Burkholderia oklahomensis]|uniref:DNA-directed DNA polymerase n=3 Tax=Burkholderia oklahomensis TaxID=342113 RepID=A0AAI8FPB8_9BURK|nr:DNA polymerase III subunit gamma/tau [Burkholderia oklahomensis]AIO67984.1 DNA polymerase III, subunit gamma and tau [Burkholderia oklahomensis]AOI42245.1 DNA polymerase III subunit gamma/tau [Burkholderia oklahomensis EO147]KUY55731.1 DNA polymerase III subunit gamma/tau [Burkholderia oklahomensis EO147]KUY55790.1 DNA polymerase III subunit gamma/tau [Burkholderia oklahomensis EO147]QPS36987.1 DNA polymerase III subunit gamma/tau [Burkholderia oklahomensis]